MGKEEETDSKKTELLDDILQETEELIRIFVMSIKTAEKKPRLGVVECSVLDVCFVIRRWTFIFLAKQFCSYGVRIRELGLSFDPLSKTPAFRFQAG